MSHLFSLQRITAWEFPPWPLTYICQVDTPGLSGLRTVTGHVQQNVIFPHITRITRHLSGQNVHLSSSPSNTLRCHPRHPGVNST
ncbi:hypothetical protein FKM82_008206 [Ascaphus truei]